MGYEVTLTVQLLRRLLGPCPRFGCPLTLGVRSILIRDGRVLLVRHTYGERGWYLPGGGVQPGETLEQAARREAAEEAGAQVEELTLFGVYTSFLEGKSDHVTVFVGEGVTATLEGDGEVDRAGFFPPSDPPAGTTPGTLRRLREYVSGQAPGYGPW